MTTTTSGLDRPAPDRPAPEPARSDGAAPDPGTVLRLGHPRELLALLPYQLGFHPQDSVVLVALRAPGRRVGLVARVDLPAVLGRDGPRELRRVAAHLAADGAAEVVAVVYEDEDDPRDPDRGLRPPPGSRAARAAEVARRAADELGPVTVWFVGHGRYLGLDCRDGGCCPPGGRPLEDLAGGVLAGRLVGPRGGVAASRDALGAVRAAPAGRRRSAAAARARWLDGLLRAQDAAGVLRWRQRSLAAWRGVLEAARADLGAPPPAVALGRVEAALLDPVVRDAVVLTLVDPDGDDLPDALLRAAPGGLPAPPRDPAADAWSGGGAAEPAPDVARAATGTEPGAEGAAGTEDPAWAEDPAGTDDPARAEDRTGSAGGPGAGHGVVDATAADDRGSGGGAPGDDPAAPRDDLPMTVSERVRDALDVLVDPDRGREPREDVAAAARVALEAVVAHGRRDRQAPALTLLALLAWWDGDAVRASVLVERALDHDPGHRLAELLDRALGAGLPPGWVRRRC
ncbi:DUF4192 domain-containing protein [Cellulomonas pakistanensis]|uniref:DUF4192 domain-containing protein n=1 Tax=Cellulomonas pakistanensis TaxID=992287 RepID=A0A919U481_9CELL|nr:DUF4192 domain-containing protein [Cellulomonas pakistanensis]GIG38078.1 hypothetical protein Cpa01nite_34590 [Cellulomonas pakistanensis]